MQKRLLIYIEPLIEAGWPHSRLWWMKFAEKSLSSILGKDFDWDKQCRIITSDYFKRLALQGGEPVKYLNLDVWATYPQEFIIDVSIRECWNMLGKDCTETAKRWADNFYTEDELDRVSGFFQNKLGDFIPNLILTFSAVPFLENAFPHAVVLHQEAGILSQPPYPYTLLFDPVGVRGRSSIQKFSKELSALEYDDEVEFGIGLFRKTFIQDCLLPASPFSQLRNELKQKYKSIWIWPNQWHFMAGWSHQLPMQHMWDMMTWVLEKAGPKTGIIFTEHPSGELYFTKERISYWKQMFPNFIYIENEWRVSAATQYLMDLADGVICLNSSVGFQSLFWKKKLIVLQDTQYNNIADGVELDNLDDIAQEPWDAQKDAQLYWLLTHYNILPQYLESESFCSAFIDRCMAAKQDHGEIIFSVFEPYINAKEVMTDIVGMCDQNIPVSRLKNLSNLNLETCIEIIRKEKFIR
ncbi:hypothetical protein [Kiloniella litopenaei]|uniref:capsular polysaccharide export protein, LipB/KpsS family n=1 Tax=Kiloniella litopenaei TaxID=1549748 RepID=UPI003BA89501